mmetsp:Transcript_13529/g.47750  ORF Transcript_13529/g.47750 Transcript_13529/m.47750 type:complete len:233 (-) Transcript_13529:6443-7141(-)
MTAGPSPRGRKRPKGPPRARAERTMTTVASKRPHRQTLRRRRPRLRASSLGWSSSPARTWTDSGRYKSRICRQTWLGCCRPSSRNPGRRARSGRSSSPPRTPRRTAKNHRRSLVPRSCRRSRSGSPRSRRRRSSRPLKTRRIDSVPAARPSAPKKCRWRTRRTPSRSSMASWRAMRAGRGGMRWPSACSRSHGDVGKTNGKLSSGSGSRWMTNSKRSCRTQGTMRVARTPTT